MKRYPPPSRTEYERIQKARSALKWTFNGVTREDVEWVFQHTPPEEASGPILCLGVRNGGELDLFREIFATELVQGVELCTHGTRVDVWNGSFDAMPTEWAGRFALLYSNALDHAYDPAATAREWCRVAQPGACLALGLDPESEPNATNPIAQITLEDLAEWFGGALCIADSDPPRRVLWRLPGHS